jgi:4-amino-4-deoxy-L-arabinose transferase-like glycosyltransferase
MSWKEKIIEKKLYILLFGVGILNLIVFWYFFGFHNNNDTDSFIWTIERYRGIDSPLYTTRFLNPFYPIIAATILRWASPALSIIIINIAFYFGLIFFTFKLIESVFKSKFTALVSVFILISAYPMLRYALTQVQDIGGYFWFLLTIYMSWQWWKQKQDVYLFIGGLAVGMGMLVKESGAMGALFIAVLFLLDKSSIKQKLVYFLKFSLLPFIILLINQYQARRVNYNSAQWFVDNWKMFGHEFTLFKWLGVNATTYNVLWLFILLGVILLVKNRKIIDTDIKVYLLAVVPASFCYFAWPIFIARTVFISAWLCIPIAAYAINAVWIKGNKYKYVACAMIVVAVVMPYVLQYTLRYAHLFMIIENCNKSISCSWNYFWENRENFSKLK